MVVDDDAAFRTRLVKALAARGIEARGAASGEEALAAAPAFAPGAAIVDLRMHGMSGLDLVRELTAQQPGIQVLVLTGYGSIATAVEAVRRGAMNYLNKPVDTEQILAAFGREGESWRAAARRARPRLPMRAPWKSPPSPASSGNTSRRVLFDCEGNISLAARRLGLHRRSLQRKLAKLPPLE